MAAGFSTSLPEPVRWVWKRFPADAAARSLLKNGVEGRGLLWENIEQFGLHGRARILRRDATKAGSVGNIEPFHFVFADPPYGQGLGEAALLSAHQGGLDCARCPGGSGGKGRMSASPVIRCFSRWRAGCSAITRIDFFRYKSA